MSSAVSRVPPAIHLPAPFDAPKALLLGCFLAFSVKQAGTCRPDCKKRAVSVAREMLLRSEKASKIAGLPVSARKLTGFSIVA